MTNPTLSPRTPWRRRRRLRIAGFVAAAVAAAGLMTGTGASTPAVAETAGMVTALGGAPALGGPGANDGRVTHAIESTKTGNGYWVLASDGGVFTYGDAQFHGSASGQAYFAVDMARTPSGNGYWVLSGDGAVYAYGDAHYFGGANTATRDEGFTAIVPTVSGNGYWLFGTRGGVFSFGDAQFYGSARNLQLNGVVVDAARTRSGNGYWIAASDGGVFAFGDAPFVGSATSFDHADVHAIVPATDRDGYLLVAADGGVFTYNAAFPGSAAGTNENTYTVDAVARPGGGVWLLTGPDTTPKAASAPAGVLPAGGVWEALRNCESGGDYTINTGNGFYGAYQFALGTWRAMGTGYDYPHDAPFWVQDDAAQRLQAQAGWGPWPACSRKLGLR